MDNTIVDLDKLPMDIAKHLDFSGNKYLDASPFGACLWNDEEYFRLERSLVKYFQQSVLSSEIFPIMNQLYFYTKKSAFNTIDYITCTDSCDNFTIDDRIDHFRYLVRHGRIPDDGYKQSSCMIKKSIEYLLDKNCISLRKTNRACNTVSVVAYGFTSNNKYKFKELSYIGLFHLLSIIDAANTSSVNINKMLKPLKLFLVIHDIDLLQNDINNDNDFKIHRVGDNIAIEFPIMHHAIYNKFKLDYYGIFYDNYERCSIIISQKFHKDFFSIFDDDGFVVLEKIVDLAYTKKMMFLCIDHDSRIEYGRLDIASASFYELDNLINYDELKRRGFQNVWADRNT